MKKGKAVTLIVIFSVILAALLFISVTPTLPVGVKNFNSLLATVDLGVDLGGGYYTVYYPDGVISASEYDGEDEETQEDYIAYKGIYLSKDIAIEENGTVTVDDDNFLEDFDLALKSIKKRMEDMKLIGYTVKVENDYTISVTIPYLSDGASESTIFDTLSYSGGLHITDSEITTNRSEQASRWTKDEVKRASVVGTDDGYAVGIHFTSDGREKLADLTADMVEAESETLYIYLGLNQLITLDVEEELDEKVIYISGSYSTREEAQIVAAVINSVLDDDDIFELDVNYFSVWEVEAAYGANAALFIAILVGALFLIMIVCSLVRYKGLGLAHTFGFLTWVLLLIACIALIPDMAIDIGGVFAVIISAVIMVAFNVYAYRNIREEYATGKTLNASIKAGYKRSLAFTIDAHIVLIAVSVALWLISTGTVAFMGFVLLCGTVLSAFCTLVMTRFYLFLFNCAVKDKYKFCGFKRNYGDEDEEEEEESFLPAETEEDGGVV